MDWDPNASDTDGYICPPCPVFYPTAEEFQHPLKYISSIRHIGMQAGICKIVPPKGWRPPFAINEKTFRFRTRVQQLNCIEGHSRAEGQFVEALRLFLYQRGQPMKELPRADGQLVNLHLLYKTVVLFGGFEKVCTTNRWDQIVRRVGRTKSASDPSAALCATYQQHYKATLLAYEKKEKKKEATPSGMNSSGDTKATPSSKPRTLSGRKRSISTHYQENETEEGVRVKRTLFSEGSSEENERTISLNPKKQRKEHQKKVRPRDFEPESLKPSDTRNERLGAPEILAGQKFYRFFPDSGAILAEVKRVFGGKKPHVAVRYIDDGSNDDVELSTMEILIANGWDAKAAELAFNSEICQVCLRGDCWDRMLLCDGCNSGQHLFCLEKPLAQVPTGDWYCKECVEDAMDSEKGKTNPKFGFDMGAEISMMDYKERADAWKRKYFSLPLEVNPDVAISDLELEREYWRLLSIPVHEQRLEVQYGSDVDTGANGSGFPRLDLFLKNLRSVTKRWKNLNGKAKTEYVRELSEFFAHGLRTNLAVFAGGANDSSEAAKSLEELLQRYAKDDWNLNNMPKLAGSVLQHLDEDIKGVMVPWLYAGMCFSTFCWHVEDHNFYSTSYLHCGAPKTWYGIPCASAELMERTMKELTPELFGSQPDLHMQLVTMFSPQKLREHGVPVYRATHRPNEFIVTFPSAYHAGFNNGFNCAEAVNFATVDWLPWGAKSLRKYREFRKLPVFCHEALVCTLAETLVDGSDFDFELTKTALLPAVEQLLQDYCTFKNCVKDSTSELKVEKRETMEEFEKHQFRTGNGANEEHFASSMRRNMVARKCNKPQSANAVAQKSCINPQSANSGSRKMKMEMSDSSQKTRMVLWAGRSGKNEGLRCVICKQYCYLQAVVCTKCRPPYSNTGGSTVGCLEHYSTMCKCKNSANLVYLYRYEAVRLEELLAGIHTRLNSAQAWNNECDDVVFATKKVEMKPTLVDLKRLVSRGKACGGVDRERLDTLELAISGAEEWSSRATQVFATVKQKHKHVNIQEFEALLKDSEKSIIEPLELKEVRHVVMEWRAVRAAADEMLKSTENVLLSKSMSRIQVRFTDTSSCISCMGAPNVLLLENVHFGQLSTAIARVGDRLRDYKESANGVQNRLANAQKYLQIVCKVNVLVASIVERYHGSSAMGAPTQVKAEQIVREADELQLPEARAIANVEILRKLLTATQTAVVEVQKALYDRSKSTEELQMLLRRAKAMPIPPTNEKELSERLENCRRWEERAREILHVVPGSESKCKSVIERPSLEEIETFCTQADVHFVSTSSLLRRQIQSRLQDCRRWYEAVHALFLRPSNSHLSLGQFLREALAKAQQPDLHLHSRLHCVCQQVVSERAQFVTCQGCQRYFHPQCVPELLPQRSQESFFCGSCRPPRKRTNCAKKLQVFCVCRGNEQSPMICCDFCDEWYHATCVDLSPRELDGIEAFRCPRCSRRQNLYYLDKKLLRRECLGRRPTLARVESFLHQMQTQLVACPPGAHELLAYVHAVKSVESDVVKFAQKFALREFSPAVYATPNYMKTQESHVLALMERVTSLEVGLETAQMQLGAVHWCLRACQLVLGPNTHAPRYSHLAALLQDVQNLEPNFGFPRDEYRLMQLTIADRVSKAAQWLRATKTLEVEEWNVEKARRLQRESEELGAYLQLPAPELQVVQKIVETSQEEETYAERPESPSSIAWKMQRR